jgi:MFS-type transporter involved in bile tolerance (Atg22 family)
MTSLLLVAFIFGIDNTAITICLAGAVGFFLIPNPSILISYSSEVVFPIDESSSAGYLFASSQTFGFLVGFSSITYLDKTEERSQVVCYVYMGLLLLALLSVVWVKEKLKKWKFEQTEYKSRAS